MTNNVLMPPPDVEFSSVIPQQITTKTEKIEKNVFDKRNYLDFSIPEGKTSREITIRLLPVEIKDGVSEMFKIVHLHSIPVDKELGPNKVGNKSYMCLDSKNVGIDHNVYGSKCPICEEQQELWNLWHNETDVSKKKILLDSIKKLNIREYCIVRCIERGKEDEGPKFWRIPIRQDKTDAYHKIIMLAETRNKEGQEAGVNVNIFSIYNGRDLTITFTSGTGAPTVIDKGVSTPLTSDTELLNKWFYDEKKWSDVFSIKPYDYLKIAFNKEVPWFDRDSKKWVSKKDISQSIEKQTESINNDILKSEQELFSTTSSSAIDDDEDGLPF